MKIILLSPTILKQAGGAQTAQIAVDYEVENASHPIRKFGFDRREASVVLPEVGVREAPKPQIEEDLGDVEVEACRIARSCQ